MKSTPIGPWPAGMDNVSSVTALPKGAVVDALNGVFVESGEFIRRDGEEAILAAGIHSSWQDGDITYAVLNGVFGTLDFNPILTLTPLYTLPTNEPVSYTKLNADVLLSSMSFLGILSNGVCQPLGVEMAGGFGLTAVAMGGLDEGTYGVAISCVSGTEEGGLSPVQFVDVAQGGGIQLNLPTALEAITAYRIYRTTPNGEALHFSVDAPLISTYSIGISSLGKLADTQFLTRMIPGRFVRAWQGRLLTARGRNLHVSEAMRFGLYSRQKGFVQFPHLIHWIEGLASGVYVGTAGGTYFLSGSLPSEWTLELVDITAPLNEASVVIDASDLQIELPNGTDYVVTWLSKPGFVFGLPNGAVLRPQAKQIEIDLADATGTLVVVDGVLTAIVH